jgi:hypothetical protein
MDHGNVMYHGTPVGLMEYLQTNYSLSKEAFSHLPHPGNLALYIFQLNRCDTINSQQVLSSLFSSLHNSEGFQYSSRPSVFSNNSTVDAYTRRKLVDHVNLKNENNFKLKANSRVPLRTQVRTLIHVSIRIMLTL